MCSCTACCLLKNGAKNTCSPNWLVGAQNIGSYNALPEPLHIPFPHLARHLYCLVWVPLKQLILSDAAHTFSSTRIQNQAACDWKAPTAAAIAALQNWKTIRSLAKWQGDKFYLDLCVCFDAQKHYTRVQVWKTRQRSAALLTQALATTETNTGVTIFPLPLGTKFYGLREKSFCKREIYTNAWKRGEGHSTVKSL